MAWMGRDSNGTQGSLGSLISAPYLSPRGYLTALSEHLRVPDLLSVGLEVTTVGAAINGDLDSGSLCKNVRLGMTRRPRSLFETIAVPIVTYDSRFHCSLALRTTQ